MICPACSFRYLDTKQDTIFRLQNRKPSRGTYRYSLDIGISPPQPPREQAYEKRGLE